MSEQMKLDNQCPRCHGKFVKVKEWELKGKGKHSTIIQLFRCQNCRATLRIPKKGN